MNLELSPPEAIPTSTLTSKRTSSSKRNSRYSIISRLAVIHTDYHQMSFNLDALFLESADLYEEGLRDVLSKQDSSIKPGELLWVADVGDEELDKQENEQARLRSIIANLGHQCDQWKAQAEEQAKVIANLDRGVSRDATMLNLPRDIIRRLNRLQSEIARLRAENAQLKETRKTTERENVLLGNQNESKASKLKGANKKVRHAKEVAGKEGEKAKEAVEAKQRHLASERKMKKERDDALAAMQEQEKINEKLRAELEIEQSGAPHKRDAAVDPNNTIVVISVEFEVRRIDIQRIIVELGRYQADMTAYAKAWYKKWCGLNKDNGAIPGAGSFEEDMKKARLYEDMVEKPDGCIETGAEHDGWRSRRALEAVCRDAKACFNEQA